MAMGPKEVVSVGKTRTVAANHKHVATGLPKELGNKATNQAPFKMAFQLHLNIDRKSYSLGK
jgi:hypothetical protein